METNLDCQKFFQFPAKNAQNYLRTLIHDYCHYLSPLINIPVIFLLPFDLWSSSEFENCFVSREPLNFVT